MCDKIITVHHVCMYNPKLNHMCLKINRLLFCDDTGACTMKLFVQYQLTICNFLLGVRRGGDMLNADHVTGIGT